MTQRYQGLYFKSSEGCFTPDLPRRFHSMTRMRIFWLTLKSQGTLEMARRKLTASRLGFHCRGRGGGKVSRRRERTSAPREALITVRRAKRRASPGGPGSRMQASPLSVLGHSSGRPAASSSRSRRVFLRDGLAAAPAVSSGLETAIFG